MSTTQPRTSAGDSPWERHHRLARALEHAGWQVKDMQAYLQVSEGTMTNYLHGRTKRISLSTFKEWAAATGTRWEWLRDGTGPWLRDGSDGDPLDPLDPSEVPNSTSGWNVPLSTLRCLPRAS